MKMKLTTKFIYGEHHFIPACDKSEALFQLLTNRQSIKSSELTLLGKMGYKLEFVGDVHELSKELKDNDMKLTKNTGSLLIEF